MKRIFTLLAGVAVLASVAQADEKSLAVVERSDGRALRVFLKQIKGEILVVQLDKASADTRMNLADVRSIQFSHPKYDEKAVRQSFDQADYGQVIAVLEPVTAPYLDYVSVTNNLEETLVLLMNSYIRSGNAVKARDLSTRLLANRNPAVHLQAQVGRALSALGEGDIPFAEATLKDIPDAAAALYVKACIQQTAKQPSAAIQTVVELIATHPNDREWLPTAELLGAQLYLQMGLTNSAASTARQVQKLYEGTNIGKEAQAFQAGIGQSTDKPE
jgi:tetratricopeptide (TPR) repeat protein